MESAKRNSVKCIGWVFACLVSAGQVSADDFPDTLQGDLGMGGYYTGSIVRGSQDAPTYLPYTNLQYQRAFVRIDTPGIKTLEMGYGHLELIGRISFDGIATNTPNLQGLNTRKSSLPLGIGTLQITPIGGFHLNLFHDVGASQGNRFEFSYAGKIDLNSVTLYPLVGGEYLSQNYVGYYYGVSAQEATISSFAHYQPTGSLNTYIALIADIKLTDDFHLNAYARHKKLGSAISTSPIVNKQFMDTAYVALSYRFK
jgi:outer membrane protein